MSPRFPMAIMRMSNSSCSMKNPAGSHKTQPQQRIMCERVLRHSTFLSFWVATPLCALRANRILPRAFVLRTLLIGFLPTRVVHIAEPKDCPRGRERMTSRLPPCRDRRCGVGGRQTPRHELRGGERLHRYPPRRSRGPILDGRTCFGDFDE